jgi:hypothetical protein
MALLKQSTARNRAIFMVDETDHVSGLAGLTLTITASKDGGAFASIAPTVTDRGNGWYALALTTTHTNTLGDLALHITSTGADPTDLVDEVVVQLPGELTAADVLTQAAAALTAIVADSPTPMSTRPSVASGILDLTRFLCTKREVDGSEMKTYKEDLFTEGQIFDLDDPLNPTNYTRST